MKRVLLSALSIVCLLSGAAAQAQPAPAQPAPEPQSEADAGTQAKQFFERGMAHFQLEEYDAAIGKWEDGFRIKPVPEFLYNIAQAYRLSNRPDKALTFYQKYLRMNPKAVNRPEVEKQIAALSKIVEQQRKAASAPPQEMLGEGGSKPSESKPEAKPAETAPTETKPAETKPAEKPTTTTSLPESKPAESNATQVTATAPPPKPLTKKGWFLGVVIGGAVVVVAAVAVGVALGTSGGGDSTKSLMDIRF